MHRQAHSIPFGECGRPGLPSGIAHTAKMVISRPEQDDGLTGEERLDINPNDLDVGIWTLQQPSQIGTSNRPDFGSSGWLFGSIWAGDTIESLTPKCSVKFSASVQADFHWAGLQWRHKATKSVHSSNRKKRFPMVFPRMRTWQVQWRNRGGGV